MTYTEQLPYLKAMRNTVGPDGVDWKDRNDCVVCAISYVTLIPYWKVAMTLYKVDPTHATGDGWWSHQWEKALDLLDVEFVVENYTEIKERRDSYWGGNTYYNAGTTVARWCKQNPTDRYIFGCRGHVIGIVNGTTNHKASRFRANNVYMITAIKGESL